MPYKDPDKNREYHRAERARRRARRWEYEQAVERRRRADLRAVILAEKLRRGKCSNPDCPLNGWAVTPDNASAFDFDHRDRSKKRDIVGRVRGRAGVVEEMAKCDLLCAVCHRLKTLRVGDHLSPLVGNIASSGAMHPTLF